MGTSRTNTWINKELDLTTGLGVIDIEKKTGLAAVGVLSVPNCSPDLISPKM
jgi:hypothetical protein